MSRLGGIPLRLYAHMCYRRRRHDAVRVGMCVHHVSTLSPLLYVRSGSMAVHSYGRLIPVNFLVTEPEQIEGPDGVGRVNCTTPRGAARFQTSLKDAVTEDINVNSNLYQMRNGNTATLIVNNIRKNFNNRKIYCNSLGHFFFLQISGQSEWVKVTSTHPF